MSADAIRTRRFTWHKRDITISQCVDCCHKHTTGAICTVFLAHPSETPAPGSPRQPTYRPNSAVEMRKMCFGYLPDRPVLRGVSLTAQPGEHLVLVGRTGAGKSSVLHLLGGLYSPWSGTIRVSGADPTVFTDD